MATDVRQIEHLVDRAVSPRRFMVSLLGGFSVLALILASLGIYGVVSYSVSQRVPEIGVRMALGATAGDVRRQVLGDTLILAAVGIALGAGGIARARPRHQQPVVRNLGDRSVGVWLMVRCSPWWPSSPAISRPAAHRGSIRCRRSAQSRWRLFFVRSEVRPRAKAGGPSPRANPSAAATSIFVRPKRGLPAGRLTAEGAVWALLRTRRIGALATMQDVDFGLQLRDLNQLHVEHLAQRGHLLVVFL